MSKITIMDGESSQVVADIPMPDPVVWNCVYQAAPTSTQRMLDNAAQMTRAPNKQPSQLNRVSIKQLLIQLISAAGSISELRGQYSFSFTNRITGQLQKRVKRASGFVIDGRPCLIDCGQAGVCQLVFSDVPWNASSTDKFRDLRGVNEIVDDNGVKICFHQKGELAMFICDLRAAIHALDSTLCDEVQIVLD